MAEVIIDHSPEDNPRLNEIFEILLLAGYFRIRIASLKAFDKVVGGIAWCITSSNFQIEVEYNDQMQIGQKIKVSQIICDSLVKMKCPYTLQPFQLQGLDVNNIYPIVQWLVKFVYETRFERQKYDRELSLILGRPVTKLENIGNPNKIEGKPTQRSRINRVIQKSSHRHPIRVYSALLQYQDASATKMYNKLLNTMTKKKQKGDEDKNKSKGEIFKLLDENNEDEVAKNQTSMDDFGHFNNNQKFSMQKLEHIISLNKTAIQEGIQEKDYELDEELAKQLQKSHSENNILDHKQKTQSGNLKHNEIKARKQQNLKYQNKIDVLAGQLVSFQAISNRLDEEIRDIQVKHRAAEQITNREIAKNQQYRQAEREITEQLQLNKNKVSLKLEKLVEKRQMLKNKKIDVKKKAKARIDELNTQFQLVQSSVPEIDEEAFKYMLKQAEMKKQIFDKKYEELTLVNQELAVLQRKAQNYTSPPEIAQYHQRFVELFEAINVLIEQKRSMFSQITNLESLKKVAANYSEILGNIKIGYSNVKKKGELKEFNNDILEILRGLEANMKNSEATHAKIKSKRESVYGECMDLIRLERDYLHLLRLLKIEFENATRVYN